jgi:ABC-2 type transport system permease protein
MKKYFRVARNTWEEMLTYRFNFMMWRVRTVVILLSTYFIWYAAIPPGANVLGYDQSSILTYILLTAIVGAIVTSNRSYAIGEEINQGDLSNFLMKPLNYFSYWFSKDMGDKFMNLLFSIIELTIIFLILKPPIYIQTNFTFLALFLFSVFLAVITYFFINLLLGFVGFWSPDVWAPRFIFWIALGFFAGAYFPLDILPNTIYRIFELLPFSYLIYFPIKIYLGELAYFEILKGFLITLSWMGILFVCVQLVWRKGLRVYSAQGK